MKILSIIALFGLFACMGCRDVTVGFLNTAYCEYKPDSMVINKIPNEDENPPQYYNKADWVSAPLQGFTGTPPINVTIHNVTSSDGGDVAVFMKEAMLRGNGAFVVPVENNIPVGRYVVSLQLKNEGHSAVLNSFFTVIIK